MKVVLFCGGMGMRLREHADALPKPIIPVGHRPIIWHVMIRVSPPAPGIITEYAPSGHCTFQNSLRSSWTPCRNVRLTALHLSPADVIASRSPSVCCAVNGRSPVSGVPDVSAGDVDGAAQEMTVSAEATAAMRVGFRSRRVPAVM